MGWWVGNPPNCCALLDVYRVRPLDRCFCVPGESKGYGFVEYVSKETALHAKNMLDRKAVEDLVLCCDWLDSTHVTFESLHSKCLFVDHLPKDFRDMGQFRKVFSAVVSPPYCQVSVYLIPTFQIT